MAEYTVTQTEWEENFSLMQAGLAGQVAETNFMSYLQDALDDEALEEYNNCGSKQEKQGHHIFMSE